MDYNNLTISQYQHLNKIAKSGLNELDTQIAIASYLTGKSKQNIENLPLPKLKALLKDISFINSPVVSGNPKKYIFVKGTLFKGVTSIDDLTAGQYIDLKNFAGEGFVENLHNMVAVLYKPVFVDMNHTDKAELLKSAKLKHIYNLLFFCSAVLEKLNPTIQMSLELSVRDIQKTMNEILNGSADL